MQKFLLSMSEPLHVEETLISIMQFFQRETELDNKKIELPKAVYSYYIEVFKRPDYIVYYKNSGILVRFGK